jgi:HAE1 family hydrophobic/amphiphilic exporter-1
VTHLCRLLPLAALTLPFARRARRLTLVQLPDAATLQRTDAIIKRLDDVLAHTHGISGFSLLSNTSASYTGFYFLQLDPWHERLTPELSAVGLMRTLNQILAKEFPEAIGFAFGPPAIPGLGTAGGFTFRLQDRTSGTVQQFWGNLEKLIVAARKRPALASLITTFRPSVPQLFVEVDQDRVLKQSLQFTEVYQTLQAFLAAPTSTSSTGLGENGRSTCRPSRSIEAAPIRSTTFLLATPRAR